jgi:hypothetical protein
VHAQQRLPCPALRELEVRRPGYQEIRRQGVRRSGDQERCGSHEKPKFEVRNPKQIQITKIRNSKRTADGFFAKIGENSVRMLESWQKSIIIAQNAKLNTVQMARGP